jgi:molybdopterin molybdotransferase
VGGATTEVMQRAYPDPRETDSVRVVRPLLSVDEALERVLERACSLAPEAVPLDDAAGRVLAADATATVDLPPFRSSAMDGFAVRVADCPGTLPVGARIPAGRPASRPLGVGEAMGISTGAVVPGEADAVIPLELVTDHGDRIDIAAPPALGANIRGIGGDVRRGDLVVESGTILSGAHLAALAAAGVGELVCSRRPSVSMLVTGTELRPPGSQLRPGEIYESNGVMLAAELTRAGATVERSGAVPDDAAAHRAALERALEADVVVSSGGVSAGPHDLVRTVAADLGVEEVFWGIAVRPGKPLSFAVRGRVLLFGLPGNPVSSLVGALLFVRPALLALQGAREPGPVYRNGVLGAPVARNPRREDFVRARVDRSGDEDRLQPLSGQDSHMIVWASRADALVRVPRGEDELPVGAHVRYLELGC